MIEVIKHGQKKFKATCAHCGCEFTYEIEDVKGGSVACPDCGDYVVHSAILNSSSLHYPPNCRGIEYEPKTEYPPKTMLFVGDTTTDVRKTAAVLTKTQSDESFKVHANKATTTPCVDRW